jgi:AbrB family looped-hinge helix DNA binding protein
MRVTIDRAGRIVVPKPLRDALGLAPGQELEAGVRDGRLELSIAPTEMTLESRDGVLTAVPRAPLPPLSAEQVRTTLEHVRR